MSRKDWGNQNIIIGPSGSDENDCIKIPILGETDQNIERVMNNAFCNAATILEDARSVSEYSQIILASLSCELFLKAIIYKTKNVRVRGHDLHELFFNLNQKERDYLVNSYVERTLPKEIADADLNDEILQAVDAFENSLIVNAMCFETIRYKHELSTYLYVHAFVEDFAIDLLRLGNTLKLSE